MHILCLVHDIGACTTSVIIISKMVMSQEEEPLIWSPNNLGGNVITDASTGEAGIIANDIASEHFSEHDGNYGSLSPENVDEKEYAIPPPKIYFIFASLFTCAFLSALDTTIVTTLLTTIASDLNALPKISWIATSYLLSCSAFQPLFGKLSDIFGRKSMILLCDVCFIVGCLVCGFANSLWVLVLGRFITGIGGGGLTTLGTITMSDLISLRKRGLLQGVANIFFALGAASGGVVGGLISDNYGWRWVFLFQVPLCMAAALSIAVLLELPAGSPGLGVQGTDIMAKLKRVDALGSFFLVMSLTGIMSAAALGGNEIPFKSFSFALLLTTSLGLLAIFGYIELHVAEPAIPIKLLANRTVLASSLANWFGTMGQFAAMYYVPVYFTTVLGLTSTENGLRLIPNFVAASLSSLGSGYYMKKSGRYYNFIVIVGLCSVAGLMRIAFITPSASLLSQFTLMVLPSIGYAAMLTVTLLALIAAVAPEQQASTTSIQYAFRATGSTLGVSLASAIFQRELSESLRSIIPSVAPEGTDVEAVIKSALQSASFIYEAPKWAIPALKESYGAGCHYTFWFAVFVGILGYVSTCMLREYQLHSSMDRN